MSLGKNKQNAGGIRTRKGLKCLVGSLGKEKAIVNKMNFIYLNVILDFSWSFFFS